MPEQRVVLRNCLDHQPMDMETHLSREGFQALTRAMNEMSPEEVIAEIKASGLRGRGGAGFSCGLKWELARSSRAHEKFLICNADEGEVGTFKDRHIMEHDPFSLLEAMAIAGYAVGAEKATIYLRSEYHYLLNGLMRALEQVKGKGFLEHLEIEIREGAGAYICGEETALMDSLEGRRGEARFRPPFPLDRGLWGKPTLINNVETLMSISPILRNGAQWFNQMGTELSKGTKVFSVSGDVKRPGVYELAMGSSLKELVMDLAGAEKVKAVQVGGAAGRIIPYSEIEMPLCYETALGSGAVIVFDETRSLMDVVHRNISFLADESCGKCAPCREGIEVLMEVLDRIAVGEGVEGDINILEEVSRLMMLSSLCGLGQGAPVPLLDSLEYFRQDYENRIRQSEFLRSLNPNVA